MAGRQWVRAGIVVLAGTLATPPGARARDQETVMAIMPVSGQLDAASRLLGEDPSGRAETCRQARTEVAAGNTISARACRCTPHWSPWSGSWAETGTARRQRRSVLARRQLRNACTAATPRL